MNFVQATSYFLRVFVPVRLPCDDMQLIPYLQIDKGRKLLLGSIKNVKRKQKTCGHEVTSHLNPGLIQFSSLKKKFQVTLMCVVVRISS